MNEALWIALPFVASLGSGILAYIVSQARNEALLARERAELAGIRTELVNQSRSIGDKLNAARAEARRLALDEFLADVRVEERRFVREIGTPDARKKCLVLQERICFRNIPLSQWIQRELDMAGESPAIDAPCPAPKVEAAAGPRRLIR